MAINVWQHKGTVLANSTGHNPQQPSVIYEGNAQILSGTVFKMWYNDWNGSTAEFSYAESTNGTTWTTFASNPIISGQGFPKVYKNGSTYYAFTTNSTFTSISVYTSSNGTTWTLATSGAIGLGSAGQWDSVAVGQLNVIDIIAGTWYGYYAGHNGTSPWFMGLATSTNGTTWVKGGSNPAISFEGPSNFDWHKINGRYFGWSQVVLPNIPYTVAPTLPEVGVYYPSDILRFNSKNVLGPFNALPTPVIQRTQSSEGPTAGGGQVADPCIVSDGTNLWAFWTATASGDGEDGQTGPWMINAATAPNTTFTQLVAGYEGVQSFPIFAPSSVQLTNSAAAASDNFNRANENPLSNSGNWSTINAQTNYKNLQVISNAVTGTSNTSAAAMCWTGNAFNNDQWAQVTVTSASETTSQVGVILRSATAASTAYDLRWTGQAGSTGTFNIRKVVAGTFTTLATRTGQKVSVNDVLLGTVVGGTLTLYQNGIRVLQAADSSIASGSPGILVFGGTTTATDASVDNWSAGNVTRVLTTSTSPNQGTAVATDTFQRTNENPLSDGGAWTNLGGGAGFSVSAQVLSNAATGTSTAHGSIMAWTGNALNNDQWAQITLGTSNETGSVQGVALRASTSAATSYFGIYNGKTNTSGGTFHLQCYVAAALAFDISVTATWSVEVGDVLTAFVISNNLYLFHNGYLVNSTTDGSSRIASGSAGIYVYGGGTSATDATIAAWSAGNVTNPSASSFSYPSGCGLLLGVG